MQELHCRHGKSAFSVYSRVAGLLKDCGYLKWLHISRETMMALNVQVVKVPEARMLMLSLAATSSAQGVRGAFLAVKDLVLGEADSSGQLQSGLLQNQQRLYVTVGIIFLTVLFFARLASEYMPGSRVGS